MASDGITKYFPKSAFYESTICWDCSKYLGGCSWSRNFEPIEGWDATPRVMPNTRNYAQHPLMSYCVKSCPEFDRDSDGFGKEWLDKEAHVKQELRKMVKK